MHKRKPHKGLSKRVRVTPRGKVVRKSSFAGHLMSGKSGTRKQRLRKPKLIITKIADNVKRALVAE